MGNNVTGPARARLVGAGLLVLASPAACVGIETRMSLCVRLSAAQPPEQAAVICAHLLRRMFAAADARPYAAGALVLAGDGGRFTVHVAAGDDGQLRAAGNARVALAVGDGSPSALLQPAVRLVAEERRELPPRARDAIVVRIVPMPGGCRVDIDQRGGLRAAPFAARAAATLAVADAVTATHAALQRGGMLAAEQNARVAVERVHDAGAMVEPVWAALAHVGLAITQRARGMPAAAVRSLQAALDLAPQLAPARRELASLARDLAEPTAARAHERILAALPGLPFADIATQRRLAQSAMPGASADWLALAAERLRAGDLDAARRHAQSARAGVDTPQGPALALLATLAERAGDQRLAAELRLCQAQATRFSSDVVIALSAALARGGEPERAARWLLRSWPQLRHDAAARALLRDLSFQVGPGAAPTLAVDLVQDLATATLPASIERALGTLSPAELTAPAAMPVR